MAIFNGITGAALGAFVALLIALSHSAVVSSSLSVLLAAAVIFLSLSDKLQSGNGSQMTPELLAIILGFSAAAIVALLLGIHLRASNSLGESPLASDFSELKAIGLSEEDARKIAVASFTANEGGADAKDSTSSAGTTELLKTTSLFSTTATPANCSEMNPLSYNDLDSIRSKYLAEGEPWRTMIAALDEAQKSIPDLDPKSFILGLHHGACTNTAQ